MKSIEPNTQQTVTSTCSWCGCPDLNDHAQNCIYHGPQGHELYYIEKLTGQTVALSVLIRDLTGALAKFYKR